ncbi:putative aminotransferase TAT2 [Iris pallida]|uniref:Aminotransferase TAT2 n=1 Tax=Iris pallida TaxID=29817 RepID=A0AAX6ILF5_IRIPA|nr:putative aminotransferase TAT2 [Iris pallida]
MAPSTQVPVAATTDHDGAVHHDRAKAAARRGALARSNPNLSPDKLSIRGVVAELLSVANAEKALISLGVGDASSYQCFSEGKPFSGPLLESVGAGRFDCYAHSFGFPAARRAVAEYLSKGLKSGFCESDVFLTSGGTQALQVTLTVLATPGCNVLLPRPGFPPYESFCEVYNIEARYYDLLPQRNWEIDLDQVRTLTDCNTMGLVVINPNNPCGAVYSPNHLHQIAETAGELNIPIIADETYGHMTYGGSKFVPMATFANLASVITLGSLSKRFLVPGWRLGWLAIYDPLGTLKQVKVATELLMNVTSGPASVIQAAVPDILSDSHDQFHKKVLTVLENSADILYGRIKQIEALKCHSKPQGSMFMMVEVDTARLRGISNDMDFAKELMKEESVLVLPGTVLGMKNWVRIFFGTPADLLIDACDLIKSFCERRLIS